MKNNYTIEELIELLKKFGKEFTHNVNSDEWYKKWILLNSDIQTNGASQEKINQGNVRLNNK